MTPERWRQIDDLFDAALRLDPAERAAWLGAACRGDDDLRAEVDRLLAQDQRAERDGFLAPLEASNGSLARTGSWPRRDEPSPPCGPAPIDHAGPASLDDSGCFAPKAAIASGTRPHPIFEAPAVVRARLRELPMIYILIVAAANLWRRIVLVEDSLTVYYFDAIVVLCLGSVIALLSSRWPLSLAWLKALELGVIGLFASRVAFVQYRLMLVFSRRADPMMAQLTMKNFVLITSILILTYGLYVPKSWRRAAIVVGPLALLPFVTLWVLSWQHPEVMGWLLHGWRKSATPRFWLFSFDAMILLLLAIGSAFGARTISRLRRQVAEAWRGSAGIASAMKWVPGAWGRPGLPCERPAPEKAPAPSS